MGQSIDLELAFQIKTLFLSTARYFYQTVYEMLKLTIKTITTFTLLTHIITTNISDSVQSVFLVCWPVIDCGTPVMGSGQVLPSATPKTTRTSSHYFLYGSSYTFNCSDSFTKIGNNSVNTDEVKCMADGYWDVGDLRCEGQSRTEAFPRFLEIS